MNNTSQHVLNGSTNLLGICFVVYTVMQATGAASRSYIDELTALGAVFFVVSCFLSFLSLRSRVLERKAKFESVADYVFMSGISVVFAIVVLVSLSIVR
jgi:hypothetical protein